MVAEHYELDSQALLHRANAVTEAPRSDPGPQGLRRTVDFKLFALFVVFVPFLRFGRLFLGFFRFPLGFFGFRRAGTTTEPESTG